MRHLVFTISLSAMSLRIDGVDEQPVALKEPGGFASQCSCSRSARYNRGLLDAIVANGLANSRVAESRGF
jgi:hypothetical protein